MNRREWLVALAGAPPALLLAVRRLAAQAAPAPDDPTSLSIAALGAALETGRLTPIDITAAYLARIEQQNIALSAFITVTRDRAFDDTRRLLTALTARRSFGPLTAVPVAHKDLFATRGIRTTGGSRLYDVWVPERDADVVSRLAGAGTVLVGKTNTHELGGGVTTINPFFGTTRNPRDPARIPGGSSGGSAAAVAARLALVATGSDTGGSVRIPAALCGCVGMKPTFGLVSTAGLLGACPTFDHAGVLARTADDVAQVLAALVGEWRSTAGDASRHTSEEPTAADSFRAVYRAATARGLKGLRVGVPRAFFFDRLEAEVARAVDGALEQLRAAGAALRDVRVPVTGALYDTMFAPIAVSEIRATYAGDWVVRPDAFSKEFAAVFAGAGPSTAAVNSARAARVTFEQSVAAVLTDVDGLVMPTVPMTAPRIDGPIDGMRLLRNTWPFNAARVPAVSVPCAATDGSLPVGLQLVGRMFHDAPLLAVAAAVSRL